MKDRRYGWLEFRFTRPIPEMKKALNKLHHHDLLPNKKISGLRPHLTLLFGIHDDEVTHPQVFQQIKHIKSLPFYIDKIDCFERWHSSILKFNVNLSNQLNQYRQDVVNNLPCTLESKFNPHITIAHLKPKTGQKYQIEIEPFEIYPDRIQYFDSKKKSFLKFF